MLDWEAADACKIIKIILLSLSSFMNNSSMQKHSSMSAEPEPLNTWDLKQFYA